MERSDRVTHPVRDGRPSVGGNQEIARPRIRVVVTSEVADVTDSDSPGQRALDLCVAQPAAPSTQERPHLSWLGQVLEDDLRRITGG